MKKKILIVCIFMIIFLNSCDPGWTYYLIKPSLEEVGEAFGSKYLYKDDSLNIVLNAYDFGYITSTDIQIRTSLDSVFICPSFSYIGSPYYTDKEHISDWVQIEGFSNDSLIFEKDYLLSEIGSRSNYYQIIPLESWENDSVIIKDKVSGEKINKDEFLQPYILHKNDSLIVHFRYKSFATYKGRNISGYYSMGKSDFIFYYDIYGNENPLIFHFATKKSENHEKR